MLDRRTSFFDTALGVFQGGGCRAAAYAGALREAQARGVHFSEVAGTSAGAITAALVGAGASAQELASILEATQFNSLLRPIGRRRRRLWRLITFVFYRTRLAPFLRVIFHQGHYITDGLRDWLDGHLRRLLELDREVQFSDLVLPTWIIATDLASHKPKVWSSSLTPTDSVSMAAAASCALPFYFLPVADRYVDGGVVSNLPAFVYSGTTGRVLAFTLVGAAGDHAQTSRPLGRTVALARALIESVVGGMQTLQLQLQPHVSVIEISTGDIKATDFDKVTPAVTAELIANGQRAARDFFESELARVPPGAPRTALTRSEAETLAEFVGVLDRDIQEVVIGAHDPEWVFSLFPALLQWRLADVRVSIVLSHGGSAAREYQISLLEKLGAQVTHVPHLPREAFLVDARDPETGLGFVRVPELSGAHARIYDASMGDFFILKQARDKLLGLRGHKSGGASGKPSLVAVDPSPLIARLKTIRQYRAAYLSCGQVPISSIVPLARSVPEVKYRQAYVWRAIYADLGVAEYDPVALDFGDGHSIVVPPVVEESGGRFYLIQGNARVLRALHENRERINAVIVQGVSEPLPARPVELRRLRAVVEAPLAERYENFDYARFRKIEKVVHTSTSLRTPLRRRYR